ncbi:hypothetical protein ACJMK2_022432 [Sinanodonta woodiana]|uniref:TOG domain-containing protein n=1 Tax=Sinanodonta woodiana TaxID=1069815 RepID=A0ABD3TK18_SINWO
MQSDVSIENGYEVLQVHDGNEFLPLFPLRTLDDFVPNIVTQDTRKRLQAHSDLVPYLGDPRSSLQCDSFDAVIEGLLGWVNSSNYKISINGLEVLCLLVDRMGEDFKPHINNLLTVVVDRLGDAKDQVREQAQQLLLKLMMPASTPQYVFERMAGAFQHKLWHVREGVLICLINTINTYGARCLQFSKIVPAIIKLLEDQTPQVRETAVNALAEIYRHVGEKVRSDLARKGIPQQRLNQLFAKFDEVKMSGNMVATADMGPGRNGDRSDDETDFARPTTSKVPHAKKTLSSAGSDSGGVARKAALAGAVTEEDFIKQFEDVPNLQIYSAREVQEQMNKIKDTLNDTNAERWERRVDALKNLRAIVLYGHSDCEEFYSSLRMLEPCLITTVKDLRSQIVREGCISIAYLSQQLTSKFDHAAELLLPSLVNLIPNSAKIMATSGIVCIRFILQQTFAPRLIPIITQNINSKASVIRRYCFEFLNQILHKWPTHILEKHIAIIQESIKKGISDADSEARALSRKAFWGFSEHFKDQADALLNTLDAAKQKALQGEMSASSSSNSLNSGENTKAARVRARSASQDRGYESNTLGRIGKGHARFSSAKSDTGGDLETFKGFTSKNGIARSSSAVDLAQSRVRSTPSKRQPSSGMLAASRLSNGSTQSLPRPRTGSSNTYSSSASRVSPQDSRNRVRPGSSLSQPSSRSSSPTPRHSYITNTTAHTATMTPGRTRKTGIPRSQGTSRDSSPSRSSTHSYGRERRLSGSKINTGLSKGSAMAQRLLKPGQETEEALADALKQPIRKRHESYDSDDAASETSSVCSERSLSSYGRTSEDVGEITGLLQSGSYQDRKEGLVCLQNILRQNRYLTRIELKKLTEIFTRLFHDPHSKVFSIYLETLVDLITLHKGDLNDWLYVLLSRLLNKLGSEILGSVHAKVQRTLDCVRDNFPTDLQFGIVTKFIIDQTQSPNLKVKLAMLNYLNGLVQVMDPSDFSNSADARLVISRIITWTTEPKSVDVRKAAQSVLIGFFNLNTPEFSIMLSGLPKAFQDGATKILHVHLRSASSSEPDVLAPRNVTSPEPKNKSRPSSRGPYPHDETDTENMNPEDIYNSIKKTSAEIQNLSFNSKLDHYDDVKKKRDFTSQDSGIQDLRNDSPDSIDTRKPQYNPVHYQDEGTLNAYNKAALAEAVFDVDTEFFNEGNMDQGDVISDILTELSNHNERNEERKNAMLSLIRLTREGAFHLWDEHFKSILLILLETLGDDDGQIRALSLRVLREILRHQARRFQDYAELTSLRILEAHKDPVKEVVRSAEECAATLASNIPPEQTIRILIPIIQTASMPVNMAAIKMQNKVIAQIDNKALEEILPELIPGLLKCYEDPESVVRKASVFCLVEVYLKVGDALRPYLAGLNGSKVKLLNLYIKRAQGERDGSKAVSPLSADL